MMISTHVTKSIPTSIMQLPEDVWFQVSLYLPWDALRCCLQISKRFSEIFTRETIWASRVLFPSLKSTTSTWKQVFECPKKLTYILRLLGLGDIGRGKIREINIAYLAPFLVIAVQNFSEAYLYSYNLCDQCAFTSRVPLSLPHRIFIDQKYIAICKDGSRQVDIWSVTASKKLERKVIVLEEYLQLFSIKFINNSDWFCYSNYEKYYIYSTNGDLIHYQVGVVKNITLNQGKLFIESNFDFLAYSVTTDDQKKLLYKENVAPLSIVHSHSFIFLQPIDQKLIGISRYGDIIEVNSIEKGFNSTSLLAPRARAYIDKVYLVEKRFFLLVLPTLNRIACYDLKNLPAKTAALADLPYLSWQPIATREHVFFSLEGIAIFGFYNSETSPTSPRAEFHKLVLWNLVTGAIYETNLRKCLPYIRHPNV